MGQGLACYECYWYNGCFSNTGISLSLFCVSCWMCAAPELEYMRAQQWG
jgi:hypothetical protein